MTKPEQQEFIKQLCDNVQKDILKAKIPETWDGIELRLYISEKFSELIMGTISKKRLKEYKNSVLINGL